ncbi:MAG: hypothetical protein IPI44_23050 [Sulfuritalea sp.]|jgi:hypothetical protein|nr:hypothetical protein [Sulfuritalea sp.]
MPGFQDLPSKGRDRRQATDTSQDPITRQTPRRYQKEEAIASYWPRVFRIQLRMAHQGRALNFYRFSILVHSCFVFELIAKDRIFRFP